MDILWTFDGYSADILQTFNGHFHGHSLDILWTFSKRSLDVLVAFGGTFGKPLGVTLGSLWGHFGVILGTLWAHLGVARVASSRRRRRRRRRRLCARMCARLCAPCASPHTRTRIWGTKRIRAGGTGRKAGRAQPEAAPHATRPAESCLEWGWRGLAWVSVG